MGLLYSNYVANVKTNAVSGTLIKTFRKSFFKRFNMKSGMADYVFDETKPSLKYNSKEIVVLQIMLCGENELLAELIYKEDYDEMFEIESEDKNEGNLET